MTFAGSGQHPKVEGKKVPAVQLQLCLARILKFPEDLYRQSVCIVYMIFMQNTYIEQPRFQNKNWLPWDRPKVYRGTEASRMILKEIPQSFSSKKIPSVTAMTSVSRTSNTNLMNDMRLLNPSRIHAL